MSRAHARFALGNGGLLPEVEIPGLAWLVGMALARGEFRGRAQGGAIVLFA